MLVDARGNVRANAREGVVGRHDVEDKALQLSDKDESLHRKRLSLPMRERE